MRGFFIVRITIVLVKKGTYNSEKPIQTTAKVYRVWATWNKVDSAGEYILDYVENYRSFYSNTPMKRNHYKTECRMVNVYTNGNWSGCCICYNGRSSNY